MSAEQAKKTIELLRDELRAHNHAYYVLSKPLISDFEFDQKLKQLEQLEHDFPEFADENSPTKRVGSGITTNFKQIKHKYPMLSLSNSYSKEDILDFERRLKKGTDKPLEYVCELKYDGVAISITYKDGQFLRAVTRGDGITGEDISANVKTVKSIPLQLTGNYLPEFEIRGEIFMPKNAFKALNEQRAAQGLETYMNPRNTTSGTLKQKDSSKVATRTLDCFLYGIYGERLPHKNHYQTLKEAQHWGIKTPFIAEKFIEKHNSINGVMDFIEYWAEHRTHLDFEIDGVVIKVNDYSLQEELGFTSKFPRWAIAYKFATENKSTIVESIDYQVGRTGSITPVANLTPIEILGTIVKRASLHNAEQIEKLDIRISDTVFVEKGGEIIPKVTGVDLSKRKEHAQQTVFTTHCPACQTELIKLEGQANHYCPNTEGCKPQILGRINHFISKKAMYIDSLGSETVEQLFDHGLIQDITNLYTLKAEDLLPLERMAEKSVQNILQGIELSKQRPFSSVLYALGIRYVGETVAKKLCAHFGNIESLMQADFETLINVDEIGDKIAKSLTNFFSNAKNQTKIAFLKAQGLCFQEQERVLSSTALAGEKIVVSGTFTKFSRNQIKAEIEKHGGKNVSSISKNTTLIIVGENMGPKKKEKALSLNIPMIDEQAFINLIS